MSAFPYTVRESTKAKYPRLQVSVQKGIEVILPQGFDPGRIPEILEQKQPWIERTVQRLNQQASRVPVLAQGPFPAEIVLTSVGEQWNVTYYGTPAARVVLTEESSSLILSGSVDNATACQDLLRQWLIGQGHRHFDPWLRKLSGRMNLSFNRLSVRGQKTRWGSCSSRRTISLNFKLLFLPTPLVRYVLIHELCHLQHPNHSKAFWSLVEQHEPQYRRFDRDLRSGRSWIPQWLDP